MNRSEKLIIRLTKEEKNWLRNATKYSTKKSISEFVRTELKPEEGFGQFNKIDSSQISVLDTSK